MAQWLTVCSGDSPSGDERGVALSGGVMVWRLKRIFSLTASGALNKPLPTLWALALWECSGLQNRGGRFDPCMLSGE